MRRPTFPQLSVFTLVLTAGSLLAACDADTSAWTSGQSAPPASAAAEAGYIAPPAVTAANRRPDGLVLVGSGRAGARVRLGPPAGEAVFAVADKTGAWTVSLPPSGEVRLFGLSMTVGDRAVQSEGYLMVLPTGRVLQLRAGAGARSLASASVEPRMLTVDHDDEGGAVVSGTAPAAVPLSARVDRASAVASQAGADGHFSIGLSEPLGAGAHTIEVIDERGHDALNVPISPAAPLQTPFRGARTDYGWRVDWMTPAGGVQTTLVFDRPQNGSGVGA